jgi:hypothetical protein
MIARSKGGAKKSYGTSLFGVSNEEQIVSPPSPANRMDRTIMTGKIIIFPWHLDLLQSSMQHD